MKMNIFNGRLFFSSTLKNKMNQFQPQYDRFKVFILQSLPEGLRGHPLLLQMQQAPLSMFLVTLKTKKNMTQEEILGSILTQLELKECEVDKANLEKLWRYIEFFKKIAEECIPNV